MLTCWWMMCVCVWRRELYEVTNHFFKDSKLPKQGFLQFYHLQTSSHVSSHTQRALPSATSCPLSSASPLSSLLLRAARGDVEGSAEAGLQLGSAADVSQSLSCTCTC